MDVLAQQVYSIILSGMCQSAKVSPLNLVMTRADGYDTRFGVTYVDFETQQRYPKDSSNFLKTVR